VAWRVIAPLAFAKLVLHVGTNLFGPYEFHRDEFLYMAMGENLRLWQMDFPPLIALLSEGTRYLLGDGLWALRLPPAVLSTALLLLAALAARELGGRGFAQGLAGLCVLASGLFLRTGNLFQPVVLDQLWWSMALFALLRLGTTENPRWWLAFGACLGFGLLTKFSVLVFGFAAAAALLLTRERRWLATLWPWAAAALALLLGSPSIAGQHNLGWPLLNQMTDLQSAQLVRVSAASFLLDQAMMHAGFIVAAAGAVGLASGRLGRPYRLAGWSAILAFVTLLLLQGKSYYAGPVYPVLFGAGAVLVERIRTPWWRPTARWGLLVLLALYLIVLFPLGLPVLKPETMERYLVAIGFQSAAVTNVGAQERIPQDYADMLNWREQVREVARVYRGLPPGDQERAVILASNYGEAGAIDFYGPGFGIPGARAFVGSYWFFGPGELPGEVMILHGFTESQLSPYFGEITAAGRVTHPYAVREERDLTVYIGRRPRTTLQEAWPRWRGQN
jgi:4-amino-4-deoxy-L-arabinose transferase-like glycosyltransferase